MMLPINLGSGAVFGRRRSLLSIIHAFALTRLLPQRPQPQAVTGDISSLLTTFNDDSMTFTHTNGFQNASDPWRWQVKQRHSLRLEHYQVLNSNRISTPHVSTLFSPSPSTMPSRHDRHPSECRYILYHSTSCKGRSRSLEDVSLPLALLA